MRADEYDDERDIQDEVNVRRLSQGLPALEDLAPPARLFSAAAQDGLCELAAAIDQPVTHPMRRFPCP